MIVFSLTRDGFPSDCYRLHLLTPVYPLFRSPSWGAERQPEVGDADAVASYRSLSGRRGICFREAEEALGFSAACQAGG